MSHLQRVQSFESLLKKTKGFNSLSHFSRQDHFQKNGFNFYESCWKKRSILWVYGLRVLLRFIGLIYYIGHPQPPQLNWARVYCGCQPGPTRVALHPGRMMEKPERQPYVHWTTCYDYRGDVDYRRVFLHPSSAWSCSRSGRSWEYVHIVVDCTVCCVRLAGFLPQCWNCTLHWSSACRLCTPSGRSWTDVCVVSSGDVNDLERVSLTHEVISTSAVVPLSGMREEVLHCVSSVLQAWWRLTRGCYQLSHNAGDFLLRGDAQRNSTHNLGPSAGNFASPCTCENWHQPSRLACPL